MVFLKFALTEEEYLDYYSYVTWDSPGKTKKRNRYYVRQIAMSAFFIVVLTYFNPFTSNKIVLYAIVGYLILTLIISIFSSRANIKLQAGKIASDPLNSSLFFESEMLFSEAGIHIKDEVVETHFKWKAIIRKEESLLSYYLFTNSIQALIIPKRTLPHPEDKMMFEKVLSEHLSFEAELGHLVTD